jgi:3'-phosphoadenosine 5'-phosphosulfate sulfotransferase (PAPS reductase)/FAD synthetase
MELHPKTARDVMCSINEGLLVLVPTSMGKYSMVDTHVFVKAFAKYRVVVPVKASPDTLHACPEAPIRVRATVSDP